MFQHVGCAKALRILARILFDDAGVGHGNDHAAETVLGGMS